MREVKVASVALGLIIGVLAAEPASAFTREAPTTIAVLTQQVEGIAVGPTTLVGLANSIFAVSTSGADLFIISQFAPCDTCVTTLPITGAVTAQSNLLGLAFAREATPRLVVADAGSGQVLVLTTPTSGNSTAFVAMTLPQAFRATSFLNAITFDFNGNIYVTDSMNGIIWTAKLSATNGISVQATNWIGGTVTDPQGLLSPPTAFGRLNPFCCGANGIAFSNGETRMFVANTAFRNIIQIPVTANSIPGAPGIPGVPFILVTGINGPDGIAVQKTGSGAGRAWVAANQSDEIVVIDTVSGTTTPGRVITKTGDFNGLVAYSGLECPPDCTPIGLLFPASLAFSNDGETLYVSNPAFTQQSPACSPLPAPPPNCNPAQPVVPPSIDSAWTQKVKAYNVVKFERISGFTPLPFPK